MGVNYWLIQTFNGISYGALLFLVGSGLSLIFGVMRIVNLSHGSYFLLGGYVALTVIWTTMTALRFAGQRFAGQRLHAVSPWARTAPAGRRVDRQHR